MLQEKENFIIAIDGVAASGKGSLSRKIASHYNIPFLPTGNLYRVVAREIINRRIDQHDHKNILDIIDNIEEQELSNPLLQSDQISKMASEIAKDSQIRKKLNDFQCQWIKKQKIAVVEGRDIGTVICPNAQVKIFLTADLEIRAKRRLKDLHKLGISVNLTEVIDDLRKRDAQDSSRKNSPMKKAKDAKTLDSTNLSIEQTFEHAVEIIEKEIDKQR